jgi:hypothetical protein
VEAELRSFLTSALDGGTEYNNAGIALQIWILEVVCLNLDTTTGYPDSVFAVFFFSFHILIHAYFINFDAI